MLFSAIFYPYGV